MNTQNNEQKKWTEVGPELLAACELASRYVAKMVADETDCVVPPEKCLERLEQVIAKAKGN